jgi:hypothetical protein
MFSVINQLWFWRKVRCSRRRNRPPRIAKTSLFGTLIHTTQHYCTEFQLNSHLPIVNSKYGSSLNAANSTNGPTFLGGSRVLMIIFEQMRRNMHRNPTYRTAHGKPTFGNRFWSITGIMTPPVPAPDNATPIARLLFVLK